MQVYHVAQRDVKAEIYTRMGWINGTFHIGENHSFIDTVNQTHGFFRLTDVTVPGQRDVLPFFALQRDKTIIIIPHDGDMQIESARKCAEAEAHEATCMLEMGTIFGEIRVVANTRLSDHLVHQGGFFLMQNCAGDFNTGRDKDIQSAPIRYVAVNSHSVIGVAE